MTITLCSKCNTMKNIEGFNDCARCMEKKEMTTRELLDEYAGCYRAVDNCSDSIGGVEDCHICKEDKERMQEIIKELETSIRKEVYEDLCNNAKTSEGDEWVMHTKLIEWVKGYALSKGIDIK